MRQHRTNALFAGPDVRTQETVFHREKRHGCPGRNAHLVVDVPHMMIGRMPRYSQEIRDLTLRVATCQCAQYLDLPVAQVRRPALSRDPKLPAGRLKNRCHGLSVEAALPDLVPECRSRRVGREGWSMRSWFKLGSVAIGRGQDQCRE